MPLSKWNRVIYSNGIYFSPVALSCVIQNSRLLVELNKHAWLCSESNLKPYWSSMKLIFLPPVFEWAVSGLYFHLYLIIRVYFFKNPNQEVTYNFLKFHTYLSDLRFVLFCFFFPIVLFNLGAKHRETCFLTGSIEVSISMSFLFSLLFWCFYWLQRKEERERKG